MITEAAEFESRICRLEATVRHLRYVLCALVATFVTLAAGAFARPASPTEAREEVRTRRLVIVDKADKERAVIETSGVLVGGSDEAKSQNTNLRLVNGDGSSEISLSADPLGARLTIEAGERRALALNVWSDQGAELSSAVAKWMGGSDQSLPGAVAVVGVHLNSGGAEALLAVCRDGTGGLGVRGPESRPASMNAGIYQWGPAVTLDDGRVERAVLGSTATAPFIGPESRQASSLVLFDKDGKVIEKLPR